MALASLYLLGENSFEPGEYKAQEKSLTLNIAGDLVTIQAQTPPPSGQILVAGQSLAQQLEGKDFAIVSRTLQGGDIDSEERLVSLDFGNHKFLFMYNSSATKPSAFSIDQNQSVNVQIASDSQAGAIELTLPKSVISGITRLTADSKQAIDFEKTYESSTVISIRFTVPPRYEEY